MLLKSLRGPPFPSRENGKRGLRQLHILTHSHFDTIKPLLRAFAFSFPFILISFCIHFWNKPPWGDGPQKKKKIRIKKKEVGSHGRRSQYQLSDCIVLFMSTNGF